MMNTITTTASTSAILAIDLGKYKSVACVHDPATGEFAFTTFATTRAELRKLVGKEQPGVIVIEACLLAGWGARPVRRTWYALLGRQHPHAFVAWRIKRLRLAAIIYDVPFCSDNHRFSQITLDRFL